MKQVILLFISALITWLCFTPTVFAEYQLPSTFTSCHNSVGEIVADYSSGEHAIVGIAGIKSGSDKVISVGNNNFTQCFCPPSSDSNTGVKTNWLAAGDISKEDQNVLITQGWVYISNGTDWGLSNQPYLAKNTEFSCGGSGGGGSGGGGGGGEAGVSSSNSNNGSANSNSANQGGEVLGISTLAGTSNPSTRAQVVLSLLLGLLLILYGYKIQKKSI